MTFRPYPAAVPAGAVVLPLLTDGAHAYVKATVDGVEGLYLLDTGDSGAITVFRRFAAAHGLFRGPGIAYTSPGGVGGKLTYRAYRARSFALGGKTFASPPVDVSEASAGAFASKSIAGNIGVRVLANYRLTFDFTRGVVAFVPSAALAAPLPADRVGWSLTLTDAAAFTVTAVVPRAPAEQAGIRAGDRIVAIQGHNIAREHIGALEAYPLTHGRASFTVTIARAGAAPRTVTIHPRDLLPAR
jgi:membrane-associated protease RseP (regulator of RpoE activity)